MKKIMIIICILCLCGCTGFNKIDYDHITDEQIEKEILKNLSEIGKKSDLTSSNPHDYTNNEYYENIVMLGEDAVAILENMYNNGKLTGIYGYLSALAIEDITNCELYEEYKLEWSTAEEFYKLWKENNCSFRT